MGSGVLGGSDLPVRNALLTQSFRCFNEGPETMRYPSGWYARRKDRAALRRVIGVAHAVVLLTMWLVGWALLGLCALAFYLLWGVL